MMNKLFIVMLLTPLIAGCNFQETMKEVGDSIDQGLQEAKTLPDEAGKAVDEAEADLNR